MSKSILIVDEDYHTVEMAKLILKTKGYEATGSTDGAEGWELLKKIRPDLAIIEMRMPGMSAIEFCKRVRREPELAETPILITSGLVANSDKSDSFWAKGLGADDFLIKPYDPLGLLSRVEYLLRKSNYVSHGARPTTAADLNPPSDA
ncbi:MAG: response regulator, partial [Candidatus Sumerlaeaceae bacterium]|nr:response regulator [Candidatus Sumerlaeaceae bacterium]